MKENIKKGWHHSGQIHSKRTTRFVFVKSDEIRDSATGEPLEKQFLVVHSSNHLLRGKENNTNKFFNRHSTPGCFMKFWKQFDIDNIKRSMARKGITKKDL